MIQLTSFEGPYILWLDYGTEGYKPFSFQTLKEALESQKYSSGWIITKKVEYRVIEINDV